METLTSFHSMTSIVREHCIVKPIFLNLDYRDWICRSSHPTSKILEIKPPKRVQDMIYTSEFVSARYVPENDLTKNNVSLLIAALRKL